MRRIVFSTDQDHLAAECALREIPEASRVCGDLVSLIWDLCVLGESPAGERKDSLRAVYDTLLRPGSQEQMDLATDCTRVFQMRCEMNRTSATSFAVEFSPMAPPRDLPHGLLAVRFAIVVEDAGAKLLYLGKRSQNSARNSN